MTERNQSHRKTVIPRTSTYFYLKNSMQPEEYHLHVWHCDREHRHCKILVRLLKSGTACTYQYYTDRLGRSELFAWLTKNSTNNFFFIFL